MDLAFCNLIITLKSIQFKVTKHWINNKDIVNLDSLWNKFRLLEVPFSGHNNGKTR